MKKRLLALCCALVMLLLLTPLAAFASELDLETYIERAIESTKSARNISTTDTLLGNEDYMAGASGTSTDWMALAMGRFGYFDNGTYRHMYDDGDGYAK